MDLSEIEFLEYVIADDTVNVIAIYLESFKDSRKFIELCKKAKSMPNKTIILLRGGVTPQGQKATRSHTGSLAENSNLIEGIVKQSGVISANKQQRELMVGKIKYFLKKGTRHLWRDQEVQERLQQISHTNTV